MKKIFLLGSLLAMNAHAQFTLKADFKHNGKLPKKYSCDAFEGAVPEIRWSGAPSGTKSFALIADDPDAPMAEPFVHWVVYNIPGDAIEVQGGVEGKNSGKKLGYYPACPPSGEHRYFFTVYALDSMLDLPAGSTKNTLLSAMKNHILAQASIIGLYERK